MEFLAHFMSGAPRHHYMKTYERVRGGMIPGVLGRLHRGGKTRAELLAMLPQVERTLAIRRQTHISKLRKMVKKLKKPTDKQNKINLLMRHDQATLLRAINPDEESHIRREMRTKNKGYIASYMYEQNISVQKRGRSTSLAAGATGPERNQKRSKPAMKLINEDQTGIASGPALMRRDNSDAPAMPADAPAMPTGRPRGYTSTIQIPNPVFGSSDEKTQPVSAEERMTGVSDPFAAGYGRRGTKDQQEMADQAREMNALKSARDAVQQSVNEQREQGVDNERRETENAEQMSRNNEQRAGLKQDLRNARQDTSDDAPIKVAELQAQIVGTEQAANELRAEQANLQDQKQVLSGLNMEMFDALDEPSDGEIREAENLARIETDENARNANDQRMVDDLEDYEMQRTADAGNSGQSEWFDPDIEDAQEPAWGQRRGERDQQMVSEHERERVIDMPEVLRYQADKGTEATSAFLQARLVDTNQQFDDVQAQLDDAHQQLEESADFNLQRTAESELRSERLEDKIAGYKDRLEDADLQSDKHQSEAKGLRERIGELNNLGQGGLYHAALKRTMDAEAQVKELKSGIDAARDKARSAEVGNIRKLRGEHKELWEQREGVHKASQAEAQAKYDDLKRDMEKERGVYGEQMREGERMRLQGEDLVTNLGRQANQMRTTHALQMQAAAAGAQQLQTRFDTEVGRRDVAIQGQDAKITELQGKLQHAGAQEKTIQDAIRKNAEATKRETEMKRVIDGLKEEFKRKKREGGAPGDTKRLEIELRKALDAGKAAEAARQNAEKTMKRAQADAESNIAIGFLPVHEKAFVDHVLNERMSEDVVPLVDVLNPKQRREFVDAVVKWDGSYPISQQDGTRFRKLFSKVADVDYGRIMGAMETKWNDYAKEGMGRAGIDKWNKNSILGYITGIPDQRRKLIRDLARFYRVKYADPSGKDFDFQTIAANLTKHFLKSFTDFQQFVGKVSQPQPEVHPGGIDPQQLSDLHDQMVGQRRKHESQLQDLDANTAKMKDHAQKHVEGLHKKFGEQSARVQQNVDDLKKQLGAAHNHIKRLTAEGSSKILMAGERIKKLEQGLKNAHGRRPRNPNEKRAQTKKINQLNLDIARVRKLKGEEEAAAAINEGKVEQLEGVVDDLQQKLAAAVGEQEKRGIHQLEYENVFLGARQHERNFYGRISDAVQFEQVIDEQTDATSVQRAKAKRDVARAYARWDGTLPIPSRDQGSIVGAVRALFSNSASDQQIHDRFVGRVHEAMRSEVVATTKRFKLKNWDKTSVREAVARFDDRERTTRKKMRDIASNMGVKVFQPSGPVVTMKTLLNRLTARILKDPNALVAFEAEMSEDVPDEEDDAELQQLRQERAAQEEKYSGLEEQSEQLRRELEVARSGGEASELLGTLNRKQQSEIESLNNQISELHGELSTGGTGVRELQDRLARISSGLQDALGSQSPDELMSRVRGLVDDVGRLSRANSTLERMDDPWELRDPPVGPTPTPSEAPPVDPGVMGHVHTILNRTAGIADGVRQLRERAAAHTILNRTNQLTEQVRALRERAAAPAPVAPPPPPTGYTSRMPNNNVVIKTGQERKVADDIEKRALVQRAVAIKRQKKRKPRITNIRKAYMEARRVATALLRKERKFLNDRIKKDLKQVAKASRKGVRAKKVAEVKAKWKKFKELFPHWKKIKTVEALRRLTEQVKTHRLKT